MGATIPVACVMLTALLPAASWGQDNASTQAQVLPVDGRVEAVDPVEYSIGYTSDVWTNVRGGLRPASRYLDNLDVTLAVDGERAFGWGGASIFVHGLYNNGNSLSEEVVGDLQVVSNIDAATQAARILEAWIEQRLSDRASVKAGLYDLNSEFDTNDTNVLFLNSSHGIGPDFSQSGRNGPSIFPVTALAARAEYQINGNWLLRAAILDGVPGDPARPARTTVKLGRGDGALLVGEIAYQTYRTKVAAGHWRYTGEFEHLTRVEPSGEPARGRGNSGVYMMVERKLITRDADRGLSGWLRLGIADQKYNPIRRYVGGGLVYTGLLPGREEDKLGAAVGAVTLGSPYREALQNGEIATHGQEVAVEVTYRAPLTPWLTVQPDAQFIFNPGGDRRIQDALVLGLRIEVGL
jgi:porin